MSTPEEAKAAKEKAEEEKRAKEAIKAQRKLENDKAMAAKRERMAAEKAAKAAAKAAGIEEPKKAKDKKAKGKGESPPAAVAAGGIPPSPMSKPQKAGMGRARTESIFLEENMTPSALRPHAPPVMKPKSLTKVVHPHVAELGILLKERVIVGGNARCFAMLTAIRKVCESSPFLPLPDALTRGRDNHFLEYINTNINHIFKSRDKCVGMENAVRFLKYQFSSISRNYEAVAESPLREPEATPDSPEKAQPQTLSPTPSVTASIHTAAADDRERRRVQDAVRKRVLSAVDNAIEWVTNGLRGVVSTYEHQIKEGDVILTYCRSSSVELLLTSAARNLQKFSVVVVDSAPLFEGRGLAERLHAHGVHVKYVLITAACVVMPKVTKVLIGASAVLQSGEVYSRAGTSLVCLAAKRFRKPVLCCCETYKFTTKLWLGSLTSNERSRIEHSKGAKTGAHAEGYLYDLTPKELVDMFVTELEEVGMLHPSAVAALLREREKLWSEYTYQY